MEIPDYTDTDRAMLMALTADIVSAYVSNNDCQATELSSIILNVHMTLSSIDTAHTIDVVTEKPKPAVNPKRSIGEDYIICLEDGKKFKSLKRHLMTHYNLTPEQYREKWDLDPNYPMVAPNYAQARSDLAKEMGLGRKRKKRVTK